MKNQDKIDTVRKLISELEIERDACFEHGFNFSSYQMEEEIERLGKILNSLLLNNKEVE